MGDMLSQAEIDALLNGTIVSGKSNNDDKNDTDLSLQEIDALGEIGNISMGTSATTLFTLLGQKVLITTPRVTITTWEEMSGQYTSPYVAVRVEYTHGLVGSNLMIIREEDVKIITDLMMGGEGKNIGGELTDLHLSAISEVMNQMVGSSATSMSSMFSKRIDISPPNAFVMDFGSQYPHDDFVQSEKIVKIAFKMVVGNLIDSEIMQILPIDFAKDLVDNLLNVEIDSSPAVPATPNKAPSQKSQPYNNPQEHALQQPNNKQFTQQNEYQNAYEMDQRDFGYSNNEQAKSRVPVNVQPAQFQAFDDSRISIEKRNISLIMDVPLQVTVELGRTQKLIREILEFGSGSIIELDKLAGEPVDILVNGKAIAKGEVVVIDESFGVRITDIIHPSKRI